MGIMSNRIFLLACGCLSLVLGAPFVGTVDASIHSEWKLLGANDRIEQYRKGEAKLIIKMPDGTPLPSGSSVRFELKNHAFHFGASVTQAWNLHQDPDFEQYLKYTSDLFNYSTHGFYWGWHEKKEGAFRLSEAVAKTLHWAEIHSMTIKGHPIIWHNAAPWWLKKKLDLEEVDRLISAHALRLVKDYPQVEEWDVYNEVPGAYKPFVEKHSVTQWLDYKGGPVKAVGGLLDIIRNAAPDKRYINNHFNHKEPLFKELIQGLKDADKKMDAIGIQTHMHTESQLMSEEDLWEMFQEYSKYGMPIHLTEVTIPSSRLFKNYKEMKRVKDAVKQAIRGKQTWPVVESTSELEQFQADYLHDFYTLAFSHPSVEAIVWWSMTDRREWRAAAGGLLNHAMEPKPAYHILSYLIKDKWHTDVRVLSKDGGLTSFRGFYGTYEGVVNIGRKRYTFAFENERNLEGEILVTLSESM